MQQSRGWTVATVQGVGRCKQSRRCNGPGGGPLQQSRGRAVATIQVVDRCNSRGGGPLQTVQKVQQSRVDRCNGPGGGPLQTVQKVQRFISWKFSRSEIFAEVLAGRNIRGRPTARVPNRFQKPKNKNIFERIDPVDSSTGTVHGKFENVNARRILWVTMYRIPQMAQRIQHKMQNRVQSCCGRFHPARKFCRADFEDFL